MTRRIPIAVLSLAVALSFPVVVGAQGGAQDVGGPGTPRNRLITEIPAMTVPTVVMDFDGMPAGPTSVGSIQAAFPGSVLASITLTPRAGTGIYDFQTGGGRALGGDAGGAGNLELFDVGVAFGNVDAMIIDLAALVTEFGFEVGDWSGPFNVEIFDGATSVGTFQFSTVGDDRDHFFMSDMPFDQVVLTTLPDNPPANWVVPALHVPEAAPVPFAPPVALVALFLLLAGGAAYWLSRRQIA